MTTDGNTGRDTGYGGTMWDTCREIAAPPRGGTPDHVTDHVTVDGSTFHLVPDTGYTMLIAWIAGADNLVRIPDHGQHTVRVITTDSTGTRTDTEPRTQHDQDIIDDGIDDYLAQAGVPAPPRGYRWYQRLPAAHHTRDSFDTAINTALAERDPHGHLTEPHNLVPALTDITTAQYA